MTRAEVESRARVFALDEHPTAHIVRLECRPRGKAAWDCEWELSTGVHGGMRVFELTIVEPGVDEQSPDGSSDPP